MQLRYAFRVYPDHAQRAALAKAFGCARVVFNDAVRAREEARREGKPFPKAGELSTRLITEASSSSTPTPQPTPAGCRSPIRRSASTWA